MTTKRVAYIDLLRLFLGAEQRWLETSGSMSESQIEAHLERYRVALIKAWEEAT